MNDTPAFPPLAPKRSDIESLYNSIQEEIDSSSTTIKRAKFVLKVGQKYVAKNNVSEISAGKPRYVIQDSYFVFLSEVAAREAKRYFEAKKIKVVSEEIY